MNAVLVGLELLTVNDTFHMLKFMFIPLQDFPEITLYGHVIVILNVVAYHFGL